ncbi:anion transporter [Rhodovibrio sodomensis]|uniref:Anion transporter n=1 Tax=Rhodovibrio sodomensis TaxID=1088 RepID=A0ABS1DK41_9PROT|nr:SLC13 family permease [Rhodovibrio sodomensis]MBK1669725.1 anion transporter [Rhodovibrio sodomensis]
MTVVVVVIFTVTYLGMALGRIPGLQVDRSGIAVVAAAAVLATGALSERQALNAINGHTLIVLFALMVVSAQFAAAGLYDACARWLVAFVYNPTVVLAGIVTVAGGLSTVLANDVVVFAMTPVLCSGLAGQGRDPRPFLIALATASNAGSAATPIGNPQNILIGQSGDLEFASFVQACAPPALAALAIVFVSIRFLWHTEFRTRSSHDSATRPSPGARPEPIALGRWQTGKGILAVLAVVAIFLTPVEAGLGALSVAAALLLSRRLASRDMLGAVDWPLLLLFSGLFVVVEAITATGLDASAFALLERRVGDPTALPVLGPLLLGLSNLVGNVPAVILLLGLFPELGSDELHALAVLSTLAGNFLLVGSLANLIVAERAAQCGFRLGFAAFARAGIPITLLSMTVATLWFL